MVVPASACLPPHRQSRDYIVGDSRLVGVTRANAFDGDKRCDEKEESAELTDPLDALVFLEGSNGLA